MCTPSTHSALKLSDAAWSALKFIGILDDVDDDGRPAPLALANCTCGSTLAMLATADELTRSLVEAQIKIIDGQLAKGGR